MKKTRRRRKKNPDALGYWLALAGILLGAVALAAYKAMGSKDRAKALPVSATPNDVAIGGPWTMLDVEQRGRAKDSRASRVALSRGDLVVLLLTAGAGVNMPYPVTVVGDGRAAAYNGMWALQAPPAGPQFVDFGPEHVFQIVA